ncbi:MAG: TIGR03936 family radical SAM-associated protein [Oscillospiraceae bacterium]|nr:TIGR03936 family radical SAM-associated protein [Oscillospiraceae bacterium]
MPRLLFEKTGNAVWISHLDLMRLFQRAFQRAKLPLKHSQGFNPRPYVAVALPLSVGVESVCELLDFDLDGASVPDDEIRDSLNRVLVDGVRVLDVYEDGQKIKNLALLDCVLTLEYDRGVPEGTAEAVEALFARPSLPVMKKSKNGPVEQDIIPMIRQLRVDQNDGHTVTLEARVCCQNPSLNPMQLAAAVDKYLPEFRPDFVKSRRVALYDAQGNIFR